jgi:hypothetical protein
MKILEEGLSMKDILVVTDEQRERRKKQLGIDEKDIGNQDFVMFYFKKYSKEIRELMKDSPTASIILSWLVEKAFDKRYIKETYSASVACTVETIKDECGISDNRTVKKGLTLKVSNMCSWDLMEDVLVYQN